MYLEILGRAVLAAVVAISFLVGWWCPLVAAPVCWQIWDTAFGRRRWDPERLGLNRTLADTIKFAADGISWLFWLAYLLYAILSFGRHIGNWYGWTLGVLLGLIVAQFLGLLWPYRWHTETMEGRF
jgi:hypothetical protein